MSALERAYKYSEEKLCSLRSELETLNIPCTEIVLTCGSYARREASAESDIDYFIIGSDSLQKSAGAKDYIKPSWVDDVKKAIINIVPNEPAVDGAFSNVDYLEQMLLNIGGDGDSNEKITRRMLFLLEGDWLFNERKFKAARRNILERYIAPNTADKHLSMFLLNDIIRYYRTIAVDYEFKTVEGDTPKPWGIRNIKLVFSRKLLYASGLFSIAHIAKYSRDEKIDALEELFELSAIERLKKISGETEMADVLCSYNYFLDQLEDDCVRNTLKKLTFDQRDDPVYRKLKDKGHKFTNDLITLFGNKFDPDHPIRKAVIF